MSFLNLIGGSRRQGTPVRPATTTGKTDAVSIHAQISSPSRQTSVDSLAPASHSRKRPSRAQTDSVPHIESRNTPSRSSSTTPGMRPSTGWRTGVPRILSSTLRASPSASQTSLAESYDNDTHQSSSPPESRSSSGSRRSNLPGKASASLEHEWMEVDKDSSDEDGFIEARPEDLRPAETGTDRSSHDDKPLHESVVMVEDEHEKARRLTEELSSTNQRLAAVTSEHQALQQHVKELEVENTQQTSRLKEVTDAAATASAAAAQTHAREMEERHREILELRRILEVLRLKSKEREERMEMLVRENGVLHKEITNLEDQNKREEEDLLGMKKEVDAANTALRTFRERSRVTLDAEREEKNKLKSQVDELWRKLGDLQKQSAERDEQIQQLRLSQQSTDDAFRNVQTLVDEKDQALDAIQNRYTTLERQKEQLQERAVELETEVVEARNSSQRLLAKAKEDQKHELTLVNNRVQALEEEISSYSSVTQQLRSSLQSARAETESATGLAGERATEIENLLRQIDIFEDALHAKEQQIVDISASRPSQAHLENTIRNLNSTIDRLKTDHTVERHHLKLQTTKDEVRISKLEKDLSSTREKFRDMRSRYEASEQSRRMLLDQFSRREEESRNERRESSGLSFNFSSSIIRDSTQPSNDQVFTLLKNLNYEIFQTAALFADSLCNIKRPSSLGDNTSDLIDDESTSLLGPHLLSLVRSQSNTPPESYDPYPLQTAIQATLVCCATRIMTAWYPGHWDHSDFLAATYSRIREAEGITASDTWKTMTRARLRPTTSTVLRVVDFLEECLNTIFRYAGWHAISPSPSPVASTSTATQVQTLDSLLSENRERLSALARHSLRLNVILDNVSPQLEPALVEPGSVFDHHVMEGEDGSRANDDDDDEVVATSEIGLRKVAEGSSSRRRVVVKPKVILRSAFDD